MNRYLVLAAFAVSTAGCATFDASFASPEKVVDLRGQSIAHTKRWPADIASLTTSKSTFAMLDEREPFAATDRVQDPAESIGAALASALAARHGMIVSPEPIHLVSSDPEQLVVMANVSDFILDVQTLHTGIAPVSGDGKRYRVTYAAKARLIDAVGKSVVMEGVCKADQEVGAGAARDDQPPGNQTALLGVNLTAATDDCIKTLKTKMALAP